MNLNLRNFPEDLHLRLIARSSESGYGLRELVIEAIDNLLGDKHIVTCPLCGVDGPLVRFGGNARCFHCDCGFVVPEGV